MTAQELKDYFRTTLVAQRTIAQEFLALDALVDFANQNDNTSIPDWTGSLTFQLDGSDDGAFCTEPDTNGRIRFFKTKVNNNTNNTPPTDPLITENAYWIEVSPGDGSAVKEWAPGVYGEGLIIVYFDTSGTGADPDLYVLAEATRPFHSTNFTTELAAGKWKRMQTVFDVAATGGTDVMNIGTTNADVINIGRVGATVNIYGNTIYSQVTNLEVSDKLIRLNRGGAAASAGGSGFELEENAVVTGYIKTSSDRNGYELKAPNQAGVVTLEFNASGDLFIKPAGTTKLTVSSTGAAVAGNVSNTGALFFSGAVSPAQITGNQNDYNPTDFHNFANVRLSSDASRDITGFGAPVAGEFKLVHNVGSFDIVFKNSDAGSAAANRFALNADFTLKADQSTIFWYDPTSSRWRAIQAGSGGAAGAWLLASGGTFTGNNVFTGTGYTLKGVWSGLGTTQTDGYGWWLANTTAAAAGAQQISPSIVFEGQGWKTNATAASQQVKYAIDILPIQSAINPNVRLRFMASINGGAYSEQGYFQTVAGGYVFAAGTFTITTGISTARTTLTPPREMVIQLNPSGGSAYGLNVALTTTSSQQGGLITTTGTWNPSSGTATYTALFFGHTISQTGSANGTVYGVDYSPSMTVLGTHIAARWSTGSHIFGHSALGANTTRIHVRGIGTTTGYSIYGENSSGTQTFGIQDNGDATLTNLILGSTGISGTTRNITTQGSDSNIGVAIYQKGTGDISFVRNAVTSARFIFTTANVNLSGGSADSTSPHTFQLSTPDGTGGATHSGSIHILTGAGHVSSNGNAGNIYLTPGLPDGTGTGGNVGLFSSNTDFDGGKRVLRIGSRTAAPSGTIVADHAYLYVEDITAGNAAVHFMTEAGDIVKMYAISGWGTPTNTLTRTTFDTSTVTLQQLAERVGALISDLKTGHGLLKA